MSRVQRLVTEGMRTSEFWMALAVLAAATILTLAGKLTDEQWTAFATVLAGSYGISRGLAKRR